MHLIFFHTNLRICSIRHFVLVIVTETHDSRAKRDEGAVLTLFGSGSHCYIITYTILKESGPWIAGLNRL